jgi:hypothetical protein
MDNDNKSWYKRVYKELIEKAKTPEYIKENEGKPLHKHHIIPKCLGGSDDKENIVKLTIRYHIIAHLLLARIYDDNADLITSAFLMSTEWTEEGRKILSSKTISRLREEFLLRTQVGKVLTEDQKAACKPFMDNDKKKTISETLKKRGELNNTNSRKVLAEGKIFDSVKLCAKHYNVHPLTMTKWIRKGKPGFSYYSNRNNKRIVGPDGTIYKSLRELSRVLGRPRKTLRNWINNYPQMGYHIIN